MAPPCTFSRSSSSPSSRAEAITWTANASLISTRSMSAMVSPAWRSARRVASTGPRPMISGLSPLTPVVTIRASGVSPSSAARVSLMITTAAAPSFSGQQLPAVTVPSARKTGLSAGDGLERGAGPRSVVGGDHGAVGQGHRSDLGVEDPGGDRLLGEVLRPDAERVLLGPADAVRGRHVLRRLAHRDVDVGQLARRARGSCQVSLVSAVRHGARLRPSANSGFWVSLGIDAGRAEAAVAGDALDAGGDERVALAGLDRVEGHPRGLHAGGAEPVDGGGRHGVQPELDGDPAGQVAAVLVARLGAAEVEVVQRGRVEARELAPAPPRSRRRPGRRAGRRQRALDRAADRRPRGGDDDGVSDQSGWARPLVTGRGRGR